MEYKNIICAGKTKKQILLPVMYTRIEMYNFVFNIKGYTAVMHIHTSSEEVTVKVILISGASYPNPSCVSSNYGKQ